MKQRFTATVALMALLSSSTVPTLTQAAESAKVLAQSNSSEASDSTESSVDTSETKTVSSKAKATTAETKQTETKATVDKVANQLALDKEEAQQALNQLNDLSNKEKNNYYYRIADAKTSAAVTAIYKEAVEANEANAKKESACQAVDSYRYLNAKQKADYKTKIQQAITIAAIDQIKTSAFQADVDAKKAVIDKQRKAKNIINRLSDLSPNQKADYKTRIDNAMSVNDVDCIVNTAREVNQSLKEARRKAERQRKEAEARRKENNQGKDNTKGTSKQKPQSTKPTSSSSTSNTTMTSSTNKNYQRSAKKVTTKPRRQSMNPNVIAALDRQLGLDDETEESSIKISPNMTGKEFIEAIADYAQEVAEKNDLYASVMIAQACLETGFGTSGLSASPYYNFFGIKGSYKGKSVTMATLEDSSAGMYSINAAFRDYPSPKESLEDYADLLKTNFYRGAWKSNTESYRDATRFLTGRYATDRNYYRKLNGIIEAYDLTQYDDPTNKGKMKRIKKVSKVYYTVRLGDTINKLAKAHNNTAKDLKEWNKETLNDINLIFPGQKLIVDKKVTYEYVKVDDNEQDSSAKQGKFNLPLKKGSYTITSPFGNRTAPNAAAGNYHEGIDLAVPMNSNVYATREGVVFASGYDASAGNYIFVYHGNGLFSNYFHLSRSTVSIGDRVKAGEVIAKSGSTGNSTGPHLHFGISHRVWGDYENPEDYVNF